MVTSLCNTSGLVSADVNGNASIADHIVLVGDGDSECRDRQQDWSDESVAHFNMGLNWSRR